MNALRTLLLLIAITCSWLGSLALSHEPQPHEFAAAMKRAAQSYRQLALHGGYVYYYSLDGAKRWGEGVASPTQVWVQPPGTPTVGEAYLKAYLATHDPFYEQAATEAAMALVSGQLKSGGWTNLIDFDKSSPQAADYRHDKQRGKNNSSLDDDQSTGALRFLIRVDQALHFKNAAIHDAALFGLRSLLAAQYACGAFPQIWTKPAEASHALKNASFPTVDWRTEGKVKNYWDMYTLNDNVAGNVCDTLMLAHAVYKEDQYLESLKRLGDWLLAAQLPEPQPGWAQQYDYDMHPIWARKFEPPAVASDETQEVILTLLKIAQATQDHRYLRPIPAAIQWLRHSRIENIHESANKLMRFARYYELQTNRPLYMVREGQSYHLTYSDQDLPSHYGWKTVDQTDHLERLLKQINSDEPLDLTNRSDRTAAEALESLDAAGRWVSVYRGESLVGQPKFSPQQSYLSSQIFAENLSLLAEALQPLK